MALNELEVLRKADDNYRRFETALKNQTINEINFEDISNNAIACGREFRLRLDYSRLSITYLNRIIGIYAKIARTREQFEYGAFLFGVYLGEALLKKELLDREFRWEFSKKHNMLGITNNGENFVFPIEHIHKKICGSNTDIAVFYIKALRFGEENITETSLRNL